MAEQAHEGPSKRSLLLPVIPIFVRADPPRDTAQRLGRDMSPMRVTIQRRSTTLLLSLPRHPGKALEFTLATVEGKDLQIFERLENVPWLCTKTEHAGFIGDKNVSVSLEPHIECLPKNCKTSYHAFTRMNGNKTHQSKGRSVLDIKTH